MRWVSTDGSDERIYYGTGPYLHAVDAATGKLITQIEDHAYQIVGLAFSPNGNRLAASNLTQVKLWDTVTGQMVLSLRGQGSIFTAVAFHPDGKSLLALDEAGRLHVWDSE